MTPKPPQKPATARQSDKPWVADIRAALDEDRERKAGKSIHSVTAFPSAGAAPKGKEQASKPASPSDGPTAPQFDQRKHLDEMEKAAQAQIKGQREKDERDAQGWNAVVTAETSARATVAAERRKEQESDSIRVAQGDGQKHAEDQSGWRKQGAADLSR